MDNVPKKEVNGLSNANSTMPVRLQIPARTKAEDADHLLAANGRFEVRSIIRSKSASNISFKILAANVIRNPPAANTRKGTSLISLTAAIPYAAREENTTNVLNRNLTRSAIS